MRKTRRVFRGKRPVIALTPEEIESMQVRRPIEQATDHGEWAGAVCPASVSGYIAWFPDTEPGIEEFTKKHYAYGFPCPLGHVGMFFNSNDVLFEITNVEVEQIQDGPWEWVVSVRRAEDG